MRADRVSYDFANWANSATSSRINGTQTPKLKNKQLAPSQNHRKSISPLRYTSVLQPTSQNDRVANSPLRKPLQQAISRCFLRDRSMDKSSSRRTLGKSSRRQQGSFIEVVKKISYQDQSNMKNVKAHSETLKFLKKYFDPNYLISTEDFISKIFQEYGNLWDNQNLEQLLQDFSYKVNQMFGVDGIDPKALIVVTKNDGMLGLIMNIFKELREQQSTRNSNYTSFSRNPQVMSINKSFEERLNYNQNVENIKNVVQQFMQSMYQCMQNQIYNKFNIEMRRMVLKYREAQKIIKKVNEKITTHADLFDLQEKLRKQKKFYEDKIGQVERTRGKLEIEVNKEKQINNQHKNYKLKLEEQNKKLKENMEKLQSALINKALQAPTTNNNTQLNTSQIGYCNDSSVNRRNTMPFSQRSQQFNNNNMNLSTLPGGGQPFQIKIDTHIIQKELSPPTTYTTTTFGGTMPTFSPLKRDQSKENMFMDGRYSYSPYGTKFQSSRMY